MSLQPNFEFLLSNSLLISFEFRFTPQFLDALASLDLKLSVSESVIDVFTASSSTGFSDYFLRCPNVHRGGGPGLDKIATISKIPF